MLLVPLGEEWRFHFEHGIGRDDGFDASCWLGDRGLNGKIASYSITVIGGCII